MFGYNVYLIPVEYLPNEDTYMGIRYSSTHS